MTPWKKAWYILRYLGPRVVWLRLGVYIDKLTGKSRRVYASRPWGEIDLAEICRPDVPADMEHYAAHKRANPQPFLFPLGQPPTIPDSITSTPGDRQPTIAERQDLLDQMRTVYCFGQVSPEPIDWYHNPLGDTRSDPAPMWCDLPSCVPEQGDLRTLWEPARAAWAIDCARIAARGSHEDPNGLLWKWIDDWMDACPPYHGSHWSCGQESSVRLFAITMGVWATGKEMSDAQWLSFARLAWATGYRVYHHINYAVSQKNNHAFSEAVGLMLVAHLFPEFRESSRWWAKGRKVLARELRRQCYADGSYLQQSTNYHRVMLQDAILGVRLAELAGEPFARDLYEIVGKASEFLFQMIDPKTGQVPLYGNNDGAHILPMSESDFLDFRPVIQAGYFLANGKRLLPAGSWDEDVLWLIGDEILDQPADALPTPQSSAFDAGGYYTLRRDEDATWMMTRCHTYHDRQGHSDTHHVDLWWKGVNVLRDCGTYQYYIPGRQDKERYFGAMAAHNVVQVDGVDALEKVGRFLTFPWSKASPRHIETDDATGLYFEGECFDYDRAPWGVLQRRAILSLPGAVWVIVDDLIGVGEHAGRWWWHLADGVVDVDAEHAGLRLHTAAGAMGLGVASTGPIDNFELIHGRDVKGQVQGFTSPYYARLDPISVLEVDSRSELPLRVVTVLSPGDAPTIELPDNGKPDGTWRIVTSNASIDIEMNRPDRDAGRMMRSWQVSGKAQSIGS
jgi:hypothetical protein